jgi:hypothetical protein
LATIDRAGLDCPLATHFWGSLALRRPEALLVCSCRVDGAGSRISVARRPRWYGFFVPAKTPAAIVEKLNAAIQAAMLTDEVKSGMAKLGVHRAY